jgi:hypothetical protein
MDIIDFIDSIFCKHPRNVGMNYCQHFAFSSVLSLQFACASIQACMHSCFPICFETSSSNYSRMISNIIDDAHNCNHAKMTK